MAPSPRSRAPRLVGLLACALVGSACTAEEVPSPRPTASVGSAHDAWTNVLLILVDDLGFDDLGCYGGAGSGTPHLDRLAREGTLFERGYVTASICSPSRAGLLTGRYQQRFGHENNTGPLERQLELGIGLPAGETLLSERLQEAGYTTGLIGKWHLGAAERFHPLRRGFDEFFGHLSGGHTYLDWDDPKNGPILRGREAVNQGSYLTDALSDEAAGFIERHRDEPFFLLLSYNAMHEPFEAPQAYLERHAAIRDAEERVYAAMLSALDDGIGRVLDAVDRAGLEERTLVVFLSDNGPRRGKAGESGDRLRGGKLSLYEGGLRVPMIVRWPGGAAAGERVATPVSSLDLVPTCLALAGLDGGPGLDGRSLWSPDGGLELPDARTFFWRQGGKSAASDGRHKVVRRATGRVEAYDLERDPAEERGEDPGAAEFAGLLAELDAWEAGLPEPAWDWSDGAGPEGARGVRSPR